jgi:hypothetical protein
MRDGTETRDGMALAEYRMAAWWWWSVPYSIVCPLLTMLLDLEKYNAHTIMLLPLTYLFFSFISSMLWTVVAVYRLSITRTIRWSQKMGLMVLASVIADGLCLWIRYR